MHLQRPLVLQTNNVSLRPLAKLALYYALLLLVTICGVAYGIYFSELFFASDKPEWIETVLNILKLSWLIPLPYALINFFSFIRYPVFQRPEFKTAARAPADSLFYFRFVTRGLNKKLIAENVARARDVLQSVLPDDQWVIEVVADHPLTLQDIDERVRIILVPTTYQTPKETLFKARSLQYALDHSPASDDDWIVHLDEETQFDQETVRAICHFARQESEAVRSGRQEYARIGQGVVLYGARQIVNRITTLADSIRVGDDYGRFRLQFEHGKAYFGIHGSYIIIQNRVEKLLGLDHGPEASITEDAYFALVAQSSGIRFSFIHTFMYEKSPFSIKDFIIQRRRWFGGLWMCVFSRHIPLKERLPLGGFMCLWSISWLCILMVYLNLLYPTGTPPWLAIVGGVSFAYYVFLYLVGFWRTFDRRKDKQHMVLYLVAQTLLIPVFSLMEAAGVFYGLISPPRSFDIVQKEIN